jgi:hypothetical protein
MAMMFILRIEHPDGEHWDALRYEEWDTLKLAEQRATHLRKQGARVEIYKIL